MCYSTFAKHHSFKTEHILHTEEGVPRHIHVLTYITGCHNTSVNPETLPRVTLMRLTWQRGCRGRQPAAVVLLQDTEREALKLGALVAHDAPVLANLWGTRKHVDSKPG